MVLIFDGWFGANDKVTRWAPNDPAPYNTIDWWISDIGVRSYRRILTENPAWQSHNPGNGNACMTRLDSFSTVLASTLGTENRPGYAARINIQDGDHCATASDLRADLTHLMRYDEAYEIWYSWSIYIPPGGFSLSGSWGMSIVQLFDTVTMDGGKSPDSIQLVPNWGGFGATVGANGSSYPDKIFGNDRLNNNPPWGSLNEGWYDIMAHYKWSKGTDGFVEYYMNGTKVGEVRNRPTIPSNSTGYYDYDIIMYQGTPQLINHALYFYNIKAGTTRADVEYIGNNNQCPPLVCNMRIT